MLHVGGVLAVGFDFIQLLHYVLDYQPLHRRKRSFFGQKRRGSFGSCVRGYDWCGRLLGNFTHFIGTGLHYPFGWGRLGSSHLHLLGTQVSRHLIIKRIT